MAAYRACSWLSATTNATVSPAKRTRSSCRAGTVCWALPPLANALIRGSLGALRWVSTSSTPGAASAAEASIEAIRPRAIVAWSRTAWVRSSKGMSAVYRAVPVALSRPSTRGTGVPTLVIPVPRSLRARGARRPWRSRPCTCCRATGPRPARRPRSASSAARTRHGRWATPPSAIRADRTTPSTTSTAAATDTRANANDPRSRTFRYPDVRALGPEGTPIPTTSSPCRRAVSRLGSSPAWG